MNVDVINRLIEDAALAAEPGVKNVKDVLDCVPSIQDIVGALRGARAAGTLQAVRLSFPSSWVSNKEAEVRFTVAYSIFDDEGLSYGSEFTFVVPYQWYGQLMA